MKTSLYNITALVLSLFLVTPAWSGENEVKDLENKLVSVFDSFVLSGRLSASELKSLATDKKINVNIELEGKPESFQLQVAWAKGMFWGWSNDFAKSDSKAQFIWDDGAVQIDYLYKNKLWQNIFMTFTFSSETIKHLYAVASIDTAVQHEPEQIALPEMVEAPIASPVVIAATSSCTAQTFSEASEESPSALVNTFVENLDGISRLSRTLATAVGEYDHLWTAVFTGCEGVGNLCQGVTSYSPMTFLKGFSQLMVAGRSGLRAYEAFRPGQNSAYELLNHIDASAKQISAFSCEMDALLETIKVSLSDVDTRIKSLVEWQMGLERLAQEKANEQNTQYKEVLHLVDLAIQEAKLAEADFSRFKAATDEISAGWGDIFSLFEELVGVLNQPVTQSQFKKTMELVAEKIAPIQENIKRLDKPMEDQEVYGRLVADHRQTQDAHIEAALKLLLLIGEKDAQRYKQMEEDNLRMHRELGEAVQALATATPSLARVAAINGAIAIEGASIETHTSLAKGEVAKMFTLTDVLVGAGVALLVPGGAPVALVAGLCSTKATQVLRHCTNLQGLGSGFAYLSERILGKRAPALAAHESK